MQKAIDVSFNRMTGEQNLAELQAALADGWTVAEIEQCGSGNMLVIVEQNPKPNTTE